MIRLAWERLTKNVKRLRHEEIAQGSGNAKENEETWLVLRKLNRSRTILAFQHLRLVALKDKSKVSSNDNV